MKYITYNCINCNTTFQVSESESIRRKNKSKNQLNFCSHKCFCNHKTKNGTTIIHCTNCKKEFILSISLQKKSKSGNHFCSKSCAATYNNTHKTKGNRRSKLIKLYPNLEFHFNQKEIINSELDIYIPSLKLAFELNGIFHYEPIYGQDKLNQIQNNDNRKFQACIERGVEMCVIDTSNIKYLKTENANQILNIIVTIISNKSKNFLS